MPAQPLSVLTVSVGGVAYPWRLTGNTLREFRALTGIPVMRFVVEDPYNDCLWMDLLYVGIIQAGGVLSQADISREIDMSDLLVFAKSVSDLINGIEKNDPPATET